MAEKQAGPSSSVTGEDDRTVVALVYRNAGRRIRRFGRHVSGVRSEQSSRWMGKEKKAVSVILLDAATGEYGKTQNPQGQADQYPFE